MKWFVKTILAVGSVSGLLAQNDPEAAAERKRLDAAASQVKANVVFNDQIYQFVSGQLISGPPVKGAPYSAEAVNESIQTLADGNRIVQRSSSMQYRDNDGRERREETSAMAAIFITDPVAGVRYTLHPETRTAEKGNGQVLSIQTGGRSGGGRGAVLALQGAVGGRGNTLRVHDQTPPGDAKIEQLGNMYIEGVQAQGTRTTTTIPAGDVGNDRPINIVDERWYSPELQMTVMTKHSDPRSGEVNFQLKNINRSNPPPTLFEVPSDYTVNAGPGGRSGGAAIRLEPPKK